MPPTAGLIDVHHHAVPPLYAAALGDAVAVPAVGRPAWTAQESLAVMDDNAIAAAVLSVTAPGLASLGPGPARRLAREVNEYLAALVARHPTRFGAFAVLPLPDIAAAGDEIAYALDVLGLDGVGLLTSYEGRYLGDPVFEPVLAELAERGAPVHVHPTTTPARDLATLGLPPSRHEFTFETTRTVAGLLYSGVLDRLPGLRLILSHAGGTLPMLAERLTRGPAVGSRPRDRPPAGVLAALRRLRYDVARSANDVALSALTALADPAHILFGSDFPSMPACHTAENTEGFHAYEGWTDTDRAAVGRDNALALLPRLAARRAL